MAEGLAEETVTALLKDSRGSLWIGSLNGLSRYDGERFKVYAAEDGLPKPRVTALAETPDGAIWIGSSRGLFRGARGEPLVRVGLPGAAVPDVRGIFIDRGGHIWVTTPGALFVLGPGTGGWDVARAEPLLDADGRVVAKLRDPVERIAKRLGRRAV